MTLRILPDHGSLSLVTHELAYATALDSIALGKPTAKVSADLSHSADETSTLTRAIVSGDEAAFTRFYDQYHGRIYGLLLLLTSGRDDAARDLQQVVMIKVARKFRVFQSEPELWAWLSQVVRNAFRDYARAQARRSRTPLAHDIEPDAAAHVQCAEPLFEWLDEALQKLDEEERLLIEEFYFKNRGQKEIAEANGQSQKAVESKLARIRTRLRTFIMRKTRHEE